GPVRLYYQGSVVRLDGTRREIFQVGVEIIDAPQPGGDLEVVALAEAALSALGIADPVVDLGHSAIVRSAVGPGAGDLGLDDGAAGLLKVRAVPAPRQPSGVLVAGEPVAAARAAAELRQSGERVVLDLDEPLASDSDLQRRAAARDLGRVAVAGPAGIRWLN